MTYYHATTADCLPSIVKNGLGGAGMFERWPGIERGVYLTEEPEHAVFVLLDWFMQSADDMASPAEFVNSVRVIVLDDTRVPRRLLGADPDIPRDGIWLYRGVIDVRNMPIIPATVFADQWQVTAPSPSGRGAP